LKTINVMMKRKEKVVSEVSGQLNSILEGTKIVGDIITKSPFKIEGEVVGNIFSQSKIEIGKAGIVCGNITCSDADIEGLLEGTIEVAQLLVLRETSKVVGDISTAKLHIEEGAIFLGECKMGVHSSVQNTTPQLSRSEGLEIE